MVLGQMSLANDHVSDHLSRLLNQNASEVEKNRHSSLSVRVEAARGELKNQRNAFTKWFDVFRCVLAVRFTAQLKCSSTT